MQPLGLDAKVSPAGSGSVMVAPTACDGPLFRVVRVYVTGCPKTMVPGDADLVSARSALACTGTVTVLVLFPGVGSVVVEVAVAELVSAVVRSAATSASTVIRT